MTAAKSWSKACHQMLHAKTTTTRQHKTQPPLQSQPTLQLHAALATPCSSSSSPGSSHRLPLGLPLPSGLLLLLLPPRLLLRLLLLPPLLLRPAGDAEPKRPRFGLLLPLRPLAAPLPTPPASRSRVSGLAERLLGLRLLLRPLLGLRERLLLPNLARPLLRDLLGLRERDLLPDLARSLLRLRDWLGLRERLLLPDLLRHLLDLPRERDLDRDDLISSSNLVPLQADNGCKRDSSNNDSSMHGAVC